MAPYARCHSMREIPTEHYSPLSLLRFAELLSRPLWNLHSAVSHWWPCLVSLSLMHLTTTLLCCRWSQPFTVSLSFPKHFFDNKSLSGLVYGFDNFSFPPRLYGRLHTLHNRVLESSNVESSLALHYSYSSKMDLSGSFCFALWQHIATSVRPWGTSNHLLVNLLILASIASTVVEWISGVAWGALGLSWTVGTTL